jgi:hypothetical protein
MSLCWQNGWKRTILEDVGSGRSWQRASYSAWKMSCCTCCSSWWRLSCSSDTVRRSSYLLLGGFSKNRVSMPQHARSWCMSWICVLTTNTLLVICSLSSLYRWLMQCHITMSWKCKGIQSTTFAIFLSNTPWPTLWVLRVNANHYLLAYITQLKLSDSSVIHRCNTFNETSNSLVNNC